MQRCRTKVRTLWCRTCLAPLKTSKVASIMLSITVAITGDDICEAAGGL